MQVKVAKAGGRLSPGKEKRRVCLGGKKVTTRKW